MSAEGNERSSDEKADFSSIWQIAHFMQRLELLLEDSIRLQLIHSTSLHDLKIFRIVQKS